jgi:DNA-binding NarL/FixJ family response regulator
VSFPGVWSVLIPTRVLLAEDNPAVAAQIRELLEPAFEVVGVVGSGEELESAFEILASAEAVIVTDIVMPGKGGLAAVRRIRERYPGTRVVLLSLVDASPIIRLGLSLGVLGFVVKEDAADELVPAIEAALDGRQYVSAAGRRNLAQ